MNELLCPAGNLESFYAAVSNGADAIYLGLDKFNARAYANNFNLENLRELVTFSHLRNVKIYVTMNTIVYDHELEEVFKTIDELAKIGIDGVIVQDLAIVNYISQNYKSLHAHASTQMGIDDLEGAKVAKDMGVTRVVFARETPLEVMKEVKKELNIEIEAFIHGALCVSYSGNCFMSSAMGERSGNRGRCAGCCRKLYTLINLDNNESIKKGYLLSMKDLNTSNYIENMRFVDSLKIEGRMKEPNYVASVANYYRNVIDKKKVNPDNLLKVFNRTYTKGYMNHEDPKDITNIEKPNNYGYEIGVVERQSKNKVWIRLSKTLNKGDQIRVESSKEFEEISIPVLRLYDSSFKVVPSMSKMAIIECDRKLNVGAKVYKTKDIQFVEEANKSITHKEYKKLPIDIEFNAQIGKPIILKLKFNNTRIFVKSDYIVEPASSSATTEENIKNQLNKLNDTPYFIRNLQIVADEDAFIPLKLINELRRNAIEDLNIQRTYVKVVKNEPVEISPVPHSLIQPEITCEVSNDEQYEVAKSLGIKHIYYKNIIRRNNAKYKEISGEVLVGGLGGINHYKNTNTVVSDYSLNVVNYKTAAILSELGVDRITLSEEISKDNINSLVENYHSTYGTYANLELIVYGRSKIMHTRYCPLKRLGMCGQCKKNSFALKDEFATFPIKFNDDCTTILLNGKILNIMDEIDDLKGINYFRLNFTTESKEETEIIIKSFQKKLTFENDTKLFNKETDTRGHFFKNPL